MRDTLKKYLRDASEARLTDDERRELEGATWSNEEYYLRLKICRDVLFGRIQDKIIEDGLGEAETLEERLASIRLLISREERKHLNWIQNVIERHERVMGGGDNPLEALAQAWQDATDRVT